MTKNKVRKNLDNAMASIKSVYITQDYSKLNNNLKKQVDKIMDDIDTAQHQIGGKKMDYYYKDTLDTDIRGIADSISKSNIKQAKALFKNASNILENHIDFDSDLQNQLANILEDIQDDIYSINNANRDIYATEVRNDVKSVDDLLNYNCGILE